VLEGMLYGLAMIAASIGGPAEILQHEQTGLLFPPRNIGAIAEALLRLLTDHELRRRIGSAAAHEVRRSWLWPHIVGKMGSVYCEVIGAT
jgi:glycosyltransferase involved in cell wall biosynthesis